MCKEIIDSKCCYSGFVICCNACVSTQGSYPSDDVERSVV